MQLTLLILKDQTTLIAQSEQLEYEPKVHLERPYVVGGKSKVTLTAWPTHSSDQHILLHSDSLLTVCEPSPSVQAMYLKRIGKTLEDFTPEPQPELLQEDEQLPTGQFDNYEDDEYEPRYQEE